MSPNLGQGSGCAMMNALALAVALDERPDVGEALQLWERRERPLTEHTQRWSTIYGAVTTWPEQLRSLAFNALGNIGWLRRRYQRTANHIPTGYRSVK
jgi:2-polyprenyl-6-methoxyphenol hydroxylase-like FAD-dependent oxidoreductase